MNYHVRDILREAVDTAKQSGIWQLLTIKEKKETVRYIYSILGAIDQF